MVEPSGEVLAAWREIRERLQRIEESGGDGQPEKIPLIDPTANVIALMAAAVQRQDDLRRAEAQRINELRIVGHDTNTALAHAESRRVDEQMALRSAYDEKLRDAEAKRIDAIRAVDVAAVAIQNERAVQQAAVLANQVSASKDALQALVASTADQLAKNLATSLSQILERLSSLEKSQYQLGGRATQQGEDRGQSNLRQGQLLAVGLAIAGWIVVVALFLLRGKP